MEDSWTVEGSMLKVYVDSIIPKTHISALVNIGVDVLVNTKIINLTAPEEKSKEAIKGVINDITNSVNTNSIKMEIVNEIIHCAHQEASYWIFS